MLERGTQDRDSFPVGWNQDEVVNVLPARQLAGLGEPIDLLVALEATITGDSANGHTDRLTEPIGVEDEQKVGQLFGEEYGTPERERE